MLINYGSRNRLYLPLQRNNILFGTEIAWGGNNEITELAGDNRRALACAGESTSRKERAIYVRQSRDMTIGGQRMQSTYPPSSPFYTRYRYSCNLMFFDGIIVYSPCVQPALMPGSVHKRIAATAVRRH